MVEIETSSDFGKTWNTVSANPDHILVIRPGAGTYVNKKVYTTLKDKYTLSYLGKTNQDDGYPKNWRRNSNLHLTIPFKTASERSNLLELAGKFPALISSNPPALIICGSRGCQVTIGLIWRHFWRGPSVMINGGCLTGTVTDIPRGVFSVLIPCGDDDLFGHHKKSGIEKLIENFNMYSEQDGIMIYLRKQGHMPLRLHEIILNIVSLALAKEKDSSKWKAELPSWCKATSLHGKKPVHQRVAFNIKNSYTLLRKTPNKKSDWGARVNNNTPVEILEELHSDDNYPMYKVKSLTDDEEGYIYAFNVQ